MVGFYRAGDPLPLRAFRLWMAFMDHCKGPEDERKPGKPCPTCRRAKGPHQLCAEGRGRFMRLPKYLRASMLKQDDIVTKIGKLAPWDESA